MRRTAAAAIVLAAAVFAFGCALPTSPMDMSGIYSLKTVNGLPLPYAFPGTGTTTVETLDDTFTLNPGGTYAETGHKRFTTGGVVNITVPVDTGNFTRRGDAVTLESLMFGSWSGTMKNGTFTLVQQGLTLVYVK